MSATPGISRQAPTQSLIPFGIVWIGQAFSLLGSSLVRFALIWYLTESTGSATVLASASLMSLVPALLLSPVAGTLVDRWNRQVVMIVADGLIAFATAVLAGLYALNAVQVWHIYVLMLVRSVGGQFHSPAMLASTTLMVAERHYARIAGLNSALGGAIGIVSPPLGALLLRILPLPGILMIDVGTALMAIVPLFFIFVPQPERRKVMQAGARQPAVLADLREGLRFVWRWPGVLILLVIIMFINLVYTPAATLIPILATDHLKGGAYELGWLQSALSVGMMIGGLTLGIWTGFERRIVPSTFALLLLGASMTVIGFSSPATLMLAVGGMLSVGFAITFGSGLRRAIVQVVVPPEMQGRVFALLFSGGTAMAPLGLALAGPVTDALGVRVWYVVCGIVVTVLGAAMFFIPAVMRMEDLTVEKRATEERS